MTIEVNGIEYTESKVIDKNNQCFGCAGYGTTICNQLPICESNIFIVKEIFLKILFSDKNNKESGFLELVSKSNYIIYDKNMSEIDRFKDKRNCLAVAEEHFIELIY